MKTHLLTKKRALISSVAMLLVAIIALGTATFAWFTSNTTATADGINVRTQKVSELEIKGKLDNAYATNIHYNVGTADAKQKFLPVSTVDGLSWYSASALAANDFAADETTISQIKTTIGESKNFNDWYISDELNIHNKGTADCSNVTITVSGIPNNYLRIALVPVTGEHETAIKQDDPENPKTFKDFILADSTDKYDGLRGTKLTEVDEITPKTSKTINVGTLKANNDKNGGDYAYYRLVVWFEGQDPDCKNANSGAMLPPITFEVTGQAVEDTGV